MFNPNRLQHALDWGVAHPVKDHVISESFVYIVRCGPFVKVGIASDPIKRLNQMQVGCPYKIMLLNTKATPAPGMLESAIHNKLASHHHTGEWFRCNNKTVCAVVSEFFKD